MTTKEIIEAAKTKAASDPANGRTALLPFTKDELLAALTPVKNNKRAAELLAGVTSAGANSLLHVQREHILEALDNEPAKV